MFNWLFGISTAIAESVDGAAPSTAASVVEMLIPFLLIGVLFYFMLIRPQRKKDKQVKDMLASLKKGDRITTIGGIYGTISELSDETVTLLVGSQRTEMVFARWAIRQVEEVSVENEGELLDK